jgi:tyrosyl-tRNA synthetase
MDVESKVSLAKRAPTEEIVTEHELKELFETKEHPNHYIGYEISGKLHIGSLIVPGYKLKDLVEAGCNCTVFLADWHAWINNKMDGDWSALKTAGEYYREAFQLVSPKVKMVLGSDLYHHNDEYWKNVLLIGKNSTVARTSKCLPIMGRKEGDSGDTSFLIYPLMQAADIKIMNIDIAHAGMDQRKAHMLARDVFPKLGWKPPIALHHSLLGGLSKPENGEENAKMGKSKPDTCIFIHDSQSEIKQKINKAWCPDKTTAGNGILSYVKYLVFHEFKSFDVHRSEKYGGDVSYGSYAEVEKDFVAGKLHSADLKSAAAEYLDKIIKPYRDYFEKPAKARLLDVFKETRVTR